MTLSEKVLKTFSKIIIFLGLLFLLSGIFEYISYDNLRRNILLQFQHTKLSSLRTVILIDGDRYDAEPFESSLKRFLHQSSKGYFRHKVSVVGIMMPDLSERDRQNLEKLEQQYSDIFSLQKISSLLKSPRLSQLPDFITSAPEALLTHDLIKFWLIDSDQAINVVVTARLFPSLYEPRKKSTYLFDCFYTKNFAKKSLFCAIYLPYSDQSRSEIFSIDKNMLLSFDKNQESDIAQLLCLSRLREASVVFEHQHHLLTLKPQRATYEKSLQQCLTAYDNNPYLYIGAKALQSWAGGPIFSHDMLITYKTIYHVAHFDHATPEPKDRLIYQGAWSAQLAKLYLKKDRINALIASCLIAQDYDALSQLHEKHPFLPTLRLIFEEYENQLSEKEHALLQDICGNNNKLLAQKYRDAVLAST